MISVCPTCDKPLLVLEYQGVAVDFCHRCRGIWLDSGELELLLERTGADAKDPLLQFQKQKGRRIKGRRKMCPRCDRPMLEIVVEGDAQRKVVVDHCARGHGLWFDATELVQLLALFPPSSGANKTVEYLKDLLGQK